MPEQNCFASSDEQTIQYIKSYNPHGNYNEVPVNHVVICQKEFFTIESSVVVYEKEDILHEEFEDIVILVKFRPQSARSNIAGQVPKKF